MTQISESAFYKCKGFTGLKLPSTLTDIDRFAFENCTGMTGTLVLPAGLEEVGMNAFKKCGFTGDLKLPKKLTYTGENAFACPGIDGTLTISSELNNLSSLFTGMYKVKKVVNNSSSIIKLVGNFIKKGDEKTYFVKKGTTQKLKAYLECTNSKATSVTIPATVKYGAMTYKVTAIAKGALKGKTKIKKKR